MMDSSQLEPLAAGASELERFVDAMTDEHLGVMVEIVGLEREARGVVGAGRAGAVVGRVVRDLCAMRDAAAEVVLDATQSDLGPLFEPGAPVGVYLTGLFMWSRGVARAMRRLVRSTQAGQPAWLPTRRRLDAAKGTYLVGLEDDSLSHAEELCRGAPPGETAVSFQRELRALVSAAGRLERTLRESFTVIPAA
jgi:hypothetical protein